MSPASTLPGRSASALTVGGSSSIHTSRANRRKSRLSHSAEPSRSREELLDFVRVRREEKELALREMRADEDSRRHGGSAYERFRIRPPTPEPHPEAPSLHEVRVKSARITAEGHRPCPVCRRVASDGYPCRVCGHAYHRQCLLRTAQIPKDDLERQLPRAQTNIGWSCPKCDDISELLTEKELDEMMEDFDQYEINKEAGITVEDYMEIKKDEFERKEGHRIGELDKMRIRAQFRCMDTNGDGMIDWWEFVKQETCKKIAKRPKEILVSMLTDLEVTTAHQLFVIFDDDDDGRISEYAVRKAYRSWYSRIAAKFTGQSPAINATVSSWSLTKPTTEDSERIDDPEVNLHVEHHCRIVLGDSEDNKCGVITWEDFLTEQAVYIICSRPNRAVCRPIE